MVCRRCSSVRCYFFPRCYYDVRTTIRGAAVHLVHVHVFAITTTYYCLFLFLVAAISLLCTRVGANVPLSSPSPPLPCISRATIGCAPPPPAFTHAPPSPCAIIQLFEPFGRARRGGVAPVAAQEQGLGERTQRRAVRERNGLVELHRLRRVHGGGHRESRHSPPPLDSCFVCAFLVFLLCQVLKREVARGSAG